MAYTCKNYKTKKALKDDLAAGKIIEVYCPGLGSIPENGTVTLKGPHYPQPHKWYAQATMKEGRVVKVR